MPKGLKKEAKTGIRNAVLEGFPVKDAKKPIVLHITKSDITKGAKKNPEACAAALACEREYHIDEARVHLSRTYLRKGKKWTRYMTPKALRTEIVAFDRGGTFEPGDYVLANPNPAKKLGAKMSNSPNKSGNAKKRLHPTIVSDVRHGPV